MSTSAKLYHVSCRGWTMDVMAHTAEDAVASGRAILEAEDAFPANLGTDSWDVEETQHDEGLFEFQALDGDSYPVAGGIEKLVASITGGGAS